MRGVFFGVCRQQSFGATTLSAALSYNASNIRYKKQSEPIDNDKFGLFCVSNA